MTRFYYEQRKNSERHIVDEKYTLDENINAH